MPPEHDKNCATWLNEPGPCDCSISNQSNLPEVRRCMNCGECWIGACPSHCTVKRHHVSEIVAITPTADIPAIIEQARQEECESCNDTGIYYEGDEWTPCQECERGQRFLGHLKTAVAEARQEEREKVREALSVAIKRHEAAACDEDPAPYKLELAKAEGLAEFLAVLDEKGDSDD